MLLRCERHSPERQSEGLARTVCEPNRTFVFWRRKAATAAEPTSGAAVLGWLLSLSFCPSMSVVSIPDLRSPSVTGLRKLGQCASAVLLDGRSQHRGTPGSVLPSAQSSAQRKNRIRNISHWELSFWMEWASFGGWSRWAQSFLGVPLCKMLSHHIGQRDGLQIVIHCLMECSPQFVGHCPLPLVHRVTLARHTSQFPLLGGSHDVGNGDVGHVPRKFVSTPRPSRARDQPRLTQCAEQRFKVRQ